MTTTSRPRPFPATRAGICPACSQAIAAGDRLVRRDGVRAEHELCPITPARPLASCRCGASVSPSGRCDSVTLFGEHRDGSL